MRPTLPPHRHHTGLGIPNLVHRTRDINPPRPLLKRPHPIQPLGRRHQRRLQPLPSPLRMPLQQQGSRPSHMRRSHGRPPKRDIPIPLLPQRRVLRPSSRDVHPRRHDLRLDPGIPHPRPPPGKTRHPIGLVHRPHRQRRVRTGRRRHRLSPIPTIVPRRHNEQGTITQPIHRLLQRIHSLGIGPTQAQIDDLDTGVHRPLDPRQDRRLRTPPAPANLPHQQPSIRRHPHVFPTGRRPGPRDRRRDMRPMPVLVGILTPLPRKVLRRRDPPTQVRVSRIDPGIEHRDLHPLPRPPRLPGGRRPDLRHTHIKAGPTHPIEPNPPPTPVPGQLFPKPRHIPLGNGNGLPTHSPQRHPNPGRPRRQDQRHIVPIPIPIPTPQQRGHIEQPRIKHPLPQPTPGIRRHHIQPIPHPGRSELHVLPPRPGINGRNEPIPELPNRDPIPGHQRDGTQIPPAGAPHIPLATHLSRRRHPQPEHGNGQPGNHPKESAHPPNQAANPTPTPASKRRVPFPEPSPPPPELSTAKISFSENCHPSPLEWISGAGGISRSSSPLLSSPLLSSPLLSSPLPRASPRHTPSAPASSSPISLLRHTFPFPFPLGATHFPTSLSSPPLCPLLFAIPLALPLSSTPSLHLSPPRSRASLDTSPAPRRRPHLAPTSPCPPGITPSSPLPPRFTPSSLPSLRHPLAPPLPSMPSHSPRNTYPQP
ncbi:hypothetical protein CLV40_11417 [Actinokineospora auranticolor]|uniref:Uncharacterized protein n=1 Tax=Actinokineospora auranticolor TaxID=155976 RepID=A0A2S6GJI0_9PSEU|nr:hypothetical protein CLV40_11417 [Actinokineospora auranticolor]